MKNTTILKNNEQIEPMQVIDNNGEVHEIYSKFIKDKEAVDYGWDKLFIENFFSGVCNLMNNKMVVVFYLVMNRDNKNKINITQRELAKKIGVSLDSVSKAISEMKRNSVLKYRNGIYMINPDVIFQGSSKKRHQAKIIYENM